MALGPRQVAPELLAKITKTLGITALDQWYHVSQTAITQAIGTRAFNNFGGTLGFLKSAYPLHEFDEDKFIPKNNNRERDQKFIEVVIRKLFPNTEIQTKARKSVGIINPETEQYLEIDFWIPSLKLGIEYQDKHHYGYQWYAHGTLEEYQKRDEIKKANMSALGYTLITIGYWWDKTLESLVATIRQFRPDLLLEHESVYVDPIPSDPPPDFITPDPVIPGVSGIMNPFIPSYNFDPTNWYAGEKHDGVRGVYNPKLNKIFSRSGNELSVLPSLLKDIPNMLVEGEIIAGRGNYNKTAPVSYHMHQDKVNWSMLRYILFDIPDAGCGNYTQRYSAITQVLSNRSFIFAQSVFRVLVVNKAHLKSLIDGIISDAGEGVITQKDSQYEYGRARGLAKIKVRRDADAQVVSVSKYSCTCKLVSGINADIIFCDNFNPSALQVGDIISYYHNGHSHGGKPKQGEIYKVRYDITWDKLINESGYDTSKRSVKETLGGEALMASKRARNKMGHWNKIANVRTFFDNFASSSGFDPLVPENWYAIKGRRLRAKGGSLLSVYSYNLKKALSRAYPELKFDLDKFRTCKTQGHWKKLPVIREFFDEFARRRGFDPHSIENWYSVTRASVRAAGGASLLNAHNFSLKKALTRAYPESKFQIEKFKIRKTKAKHEIGHWSKTSNVRAFFDEFARTSGFDPLEHENWYPVKSRSVRNAGGSGLQYNFDYSLKKALATAYPELAFNEDKFRTRVKQQH